MTGRWFTVGSVLVGASAWLAAAAGALNPIWAVTVTFLLVQMEVLRNELAGSRQFITELISSTGRSTGRAAGRDGAR